MSKETKTDNEQKAPFQVLNASEGSKEILIAGYIMSWNSNNSKDFRLAFNKLAKSGSVTIRLSNCYGGDMAEGYVMADLARRSKANVITIAEGFVASMGSVLFAAGDERKISPSAMVMTHRPTGSAYGTSDKLRTHADLQDKLEANIVKFLVKQTGQPEKEVKSWLPKGSDKWFDAEETIEKGIALEIMEDGSEEIPEAILNAIQNTPDKVLEVINSLQSEETEEDESNKNFSTQNKMKKLLIIALLAELNIENSLKAEDSDEKFAEGLKEILNAKDARIKELEGKLKTNDEEKVTNLVANAIKEGKITKDQEETYTKLAKADFEAASTALEGMSKRIDINAHLKPGAKDGKEGDATPKTFAELRKEDPDALAEMKRKDPEAYAKLFKAEYGVDPD